MERKKQQPTEAETEEEKLNGYISTFHRSEILVKHFGKFSKTIIFTSETLRKLVSHSKDRVPTEKRNDVVYQINCQDCSTAYIGEAKRSFNHRSKEHQRAVTK